MEKISIIAGDGYELSALFGRMNSTIKDAIIISAATGVKKEYYINFSQYMMHQGYAVLLYDYRGIGESAPENLRTSTASIQDWATQDMNAALNYMVQEKNFTDIVWMGHSLGAQLVGLLDNQEHIKKVISLSAAVGYWGYFPFPKNMIVWLQWYVISPLLVKIYGYGPLKKVGWGENIPRRVFMEWRQWCMSKTYYRKYLRQKWKYEKFHRFIKPITAVYPSDDFIANDKTVSLMMEFFPNAPVQILKIPVEKYTKLKVGHTGIFRKRFETTLWPVLFDIVSGAQTQPDFKKSVLLS